MRLNGCGRIESAAQPPLIADMIHGRWLRPGKGYSSMRASLVEGRFTSNYTIQISPCRWRWRHTLTTPG